MHRRRICTALALGAASLLAGTAPASAALPPGARAVAHGGCGGGAGGAGRATLTAADNGRHVCVRVGTEVLVVLRAPRPTSPRWSDVHVSPAGVLRPLALRIMPARGVVAQRLLAVHPGTVTLAAERRSCPTVSAPPWCTAEVSYAVVLTVQAGASAAKASPDGVQRGKSGPAPGHRHHSS